MRLTQSLFETRELALMCYVDDPLAALCGTLEDIRLNAAVVILVWEALGFRLAYAKGQIGSKVTWIGGTMQCQALSLKGRAVAAAHKAVDLSARLEAQAAQLAEFVGIEHGQGVGSAPRMSAMRSSALWLSASAS